ncbi:ATP-dependent RNA helicase dhx37 [Cyanidiococcus yangmingshanensis]|uniref:RNA helicase n=1 Tax=Cyanidiococcus yangmingshanensis TaxID=2690220 RepID=A0A7J7IMF9_9RHOD|nr:ATP-dependent RNA helicase dhx37 [Cyanidiococcus yangmingshanensis]
MSDEIVGSASLGTNGDSHHQSHQRFVSSSARSWQRNVDRCVTPNGSTTWLFWPETALSGAVRQRLVPSQALSAAKRVRKRKDSLASPRQVPSTTCRPLERTGAPERPPKAPGHQIMVQKRVRVRQHRTPADLAVILEHDRVATTNHIEDEVRLQTGSYPARATLPETLGGDTSAAVPSAAGDDLSQAMNASQTGQGHGCVGPSTTTEVRSASLNDPRWVSSPGEAAKLQGPQRTLVGVSMQSQTVSKRCEGETATSCAKALSGPRLDDAASLGRTPPSTQTGQVTIPATFSGPESNTYRDTIDATSGMTRRSLLTRATTSKSFFVTVHRPQSVVEQRAALPVFEMEQEFMEKLHDHGVVIVVGPTGSGKTTQIPQFLYEAGYGHPDRSRRPGGPVVVVQPRRLAAIWCAERVAAELGAEESQDPSVAETRSLVCPIRLGVQVGYHVRHQRCANDEQTRILFVTDGVLLRELASDVTLRRYGCVILDEVHERSIQMDLLLGLLSRTVRLRRSLAWQRAYPQIGPLKLVIMSATIDAETLAHHPQLFFNPDEPWIESVSTGHVPEPSSVTDAGQVPHPDAELEVSPSASSPQPEQCRASAQVHRSAHVVTPSTTSSNEACIDTSGAPTMVSSDGLATPARAASPVGFMKTKATEWKWHRPAVLTIPGRQYPVSVHFARRTHRDYLEAAREKCLKIHQRLPPWSYPCLYAWSSRHRSTLFCATANVAT